MLIQSQNDNVNNDEWAERCAYWTELTQLEIPTRKRREQQSQPLILTGHGLSIRVDKGRLLIRDGITHYPQQRQEHVFFKGSLDIPPRIILLDGFGTITLDALDWIAEQNSALIRVKWNGQFFSLISNGGQAADPVKFAWQIKAREDEGEKLTFYLPLMEGKLANTLGTLADYLSPSAAKERAIEKIRLYLHRLQNDPPNKLKMLLGIEAQVASLYFAAWRELKINWKTSRRYPIPNEWRSFYSRGSLKMKNKGGANIFATHPVNAMLNYAYTVLLGQTQLQVIADGYDPMLGVIHTRSRSQHGPPRPSFAIDMMEPMRPVVDRVILKLVAEERFSGADFDLQSNGVVRLNPELARIIAQRNPSNLGL